MEDIINFTEDSEYKRMFDQHTDAMKQQSELIESWVEKEEKKMTKQELDKIIRLIPTASDRQAEIIAGQIEVHLKMNEKRPPPMPPMSPFKNK